MSAWNQYKDARLQANLRLSRLLEGHETAWRLGAAFTFALLMGGLAQVKLFTPLTPVPFTLQVLGASLMGGLLGARWGAVSASLYVLMGVIGLPVFAGQMEDFERFQWFSGLAVFSTSLSAWYLVGFIVQALMVGLVVDRRSRERNAPLVMLAPLALALILLFVILDVYFLTDYDALYGVDGGSFRNAWFGLLLAGLLVIVAGSAWLALTTRARRERVELFFANVIGLVALYAVGMIGFRYVWDALDYGPLGASTWLAYTVVPFIPVDLAKILVAIGLLTLMRPTRRELEAARAPPQGSSARPSSPGVAP